MRFRGGEECFFGLIIRNLSIVLVENENVIFWKFLLFLYKCD